MKNFKLLAAILLLVGSVTIYSCGDDTPVATGPSFSVTEVEMNPTGTITDVDINGKVKIKNTSDAQINLYWVRNNINVPNNWLTAFCDHVLCYPVATIEGDIILEAGQEEELKLVFRPDGNRGTGSADLVLYDKADQAGSTVTHTFTATAN
jgi:hypothetical protein